MFHRQYMHAMLMECALSEEGKGPKAELVVNHKCESIDAESGTIKFHNGESVKHDGFLEGMEVSREEAEMLIMRARLAAGWIDELPAPAAEGEEHPEEPVEDPQAHAAV